MPRPSRAQLWGWGRTNPTAAEAVTVDATSVAATLKEAGPRGALVRGLGRSYGDAAQNGGGLVIRLASGAGDIALDTVGGKVTVGAGVSLDQLLRIIVPRGFFVPVTPGTRFVTIGGAIASDIHGKNHHVDGSIGPHVESITMVLADGSTITVGPHVDPDAVLGDDRRHGSDRESMVEATIRLLPIETSRMRVDTSRIADLDALMATMSSGDDDEARYSVAWIDLVAKGRNLGRSVLSRGDHARFDELDAHDSIAPFAYGPHQLVAVPPVVPPLGVLNHASIAAFNEFWFRQGARAARRSDRGNRRLLPSARLRRFLEPPVRQPRHVAVPVRGSLRRGTGHAHRRRAVVGQRRAQLPCGAETVRRSEPGATELPTGRLDAGARPARRVTRGLGDLLHGLDRVVLDAGGRHYFAKDAHMTPAAVRRGYPRLDEWKAVRHEVDPHGVWQSDLGRRLGLL